MRPARHQIGFDVVIRAVCAGGQGKKELSILRKLTTGLDIAQPVNHVLPMFEEIHFDDMVFGVFPYISTSLVYGLAGPNCSADDLINVILQMLEVWVRLGFYSSLLKF